MNLALNIFLNVLAEATTAVPEPPPISQPVLRAVLLGTLWIFSLAILIGLPVRYVIGDLWSRKTSQPYIDDAGSHH